MRAIRSNALGEDIRNRMVIDRTSSLTGGIKNHTVSARLVCKSIISKCSYSWLLGGWGSHTTSVLAVRQGELLIRTRNCGDSG